MKNYGDQGGYAITLRDLHLQFSSTHNREFFRHFLELYTDVQTTKLPRCFFVRLIVDNLRRRKLLTPE